jgi:hypothetical protein
LAFYCHANGDYSKAVDIGKLVVESYGKNLGTNHPDTLSAKN